jgi:hypothetical protein
MIAAPADRQLALLFCYGVFSLPDYVCISCPLPIPHMGENCFGPVE